MFVPRNNDTVCCLAPLVSGEEVGLGGGGERERGDRR